LGGMQTFGPFEAIRQQKQLQRRVRVMFPSIPARRQCIKWGFARIVLSQQRLETTIVGFS
jgi:hypothetical protein